MTVKLPIDPRTMPDGVVLVLNVRYAPQEDQRANPTIYSHAAIKMGSRWYLTGSRAPQDAGWGAVEAWLERDNRELVSVEIQTGTRTIWPEPVAVASPTPIIVQEETDPGAQEPSYYGDDFYYGDDSPGPKIDTPQA